MKHHYPPHQLYHQLRISPALKISCSPRIRQLGILVWLMLIGALPGQAQIYYLLNDGSVSTRTDELRKVNADGTGDVQVATNFADSPRSIVIDKTNNRAFVVEARVTITPRIYTVNLSTGASATFLSSTSLVSGMALDATNNYLYYLLSDNQPTTSVDELHRMNLDGTNDVLIGSGYVNAPGPIALDGQTNRLFISDLRASAPKIVSVNLATQTATTLVTLAANIPANGTAVDNSAGKLYYALTDNSAPTTTDELRRINVDGTGDELVATGFVNAPGDLAVDSPNNRVLLNDIRANAPKIYAINRTSKATSLLFTPGANTLSGIAVVEASCTELLSSFSVTSPSPVCTGGAVTLTANGCTGGTVSWPGGSTGNIFTTSTTGVYAATCTIGSCTTSVNGTATIGTAPTVSLSTNNVCQGQSVNLLATSGLSSYTFTGSGGVIAGSGNTRTVAGLSAGTYSFTVTASNAGGCTNTATTNVTVNALPTVNSFPTSVALTCPAPTYSLTAVGSGSFLWSTGETTPVIVASTGGVYSVTLTDANGCQATDFSTVSTNTNLPGAFLTVSGPLNCTTTSVTLTANTGNGLSFAFSSGASQIGGSSGPTATVTTPGLYSVTITGGNECTSTASVNVTSDLTPPTPSVSSVVDQLNCSTTVITLVASGGGTYLWSNGQKTANRNVNTAATYSVTVTAANGCSAVASKTITSDTTPPDLTLVASSVCEGQPVLLSATSGLVSYTFTGASGVIAGSGNTRSVTGLSAGVHSFSVVGFSSANRCTTLATASATVAAAPVPVLINNGPLSCTQTSVTLTASGGSSYTFTNGSGTLGTPGATNTFVVISPGTYSVRVVNASGCVSSTSTTVSSVTATISVSNPTVTTATLGTPFSQFFTASGGSGPYSYSLASGSLPTDLILSSTGELSGATSQSGSFPITVRATDTNGCSGTGATYTLVVNAATPTITGLTASPSSVCPGASVTFTATIGNVSGSYAYTLTNGSSPLTGNTSSTAFSQNLTASGSGLQTYTLTVTANGQTASSNTSLMVNVLPTATLIPSSTSITCGVTSITLTASGGTSYTFLSDSGLIPSSADVAIITASGNYSVIVTNSASCTALATTTIDQNTTAPTAGLNVTNGGVLTCAVPTITLTGSPVGSYSYTFSSGASQIGVGNTATVNAPGTYTLIVSGPNGCTNSVTTTISSNTTITATANVSATTALVGSVVSMTASGGVTYQWTAPASAQLSSPSTNAIVSATLTASGVQTFTVLVTNSNGCSQSQTVSVTAVEEVLGGSDLTPSLYFPSAAFTSSGVDAVRTFTMSLFEGAGKPTTKGSIVVTLTIPLGYSIAFDNTLSSINVSGGSANPVTVSNTKWSVSASSDLQLTLTINAGQGIPAGGQLVLGFTITRIGASKGTANVTVNVSDDATNGYDSNSANNIYARNMNAL